MTEKELIKLVNYKRTIKGSYEPEMYGFGKIYREMGFYPKFLPFHIICQHGVSLWDEPQSHDFNSKYPVMFVFSKRMQKAWQGISKKPCFVIQHPYIFYRKKNKILQKAEAKGAVFFLSHSTSEIKMKLAINKLISQLRKLPLKFHPITICLHYVDINKGFHKPFMKAGFSCVSAGHCEDPLFIKRFYKILSSHKYAISNAIGSYTFYSVEMGIPFSLFGERPIFENVSDTSLLSE
jgi:hypothetical protein